MKIAPNLCRHMKAVAKKGMKRSAETTHIVSPPRQSRRGHHSSMQHHQMQANHLNLPVYPPVFMKSPEVFKKKSSSRSSGELPPKRHMYTENREDLTSMAPTSDRNGPRCVSFQERADGEDSAGSNNQHHQQYESPRSHPDIELNFVSPEGQIQSGKHGHPVSVRSNRGGSRSSRSDRDESSVSSRKGFSVSNRGGRHRHISTRGRSSKSGAVRMDKDREEAQDGNDDEPLIIKSLVEKAERETKAEGEKLSS